MGRPENQGISLELVQSFLEEKGFDVAVQDREGRGRKTGALEKHREPLGGSSQVGTGWSLGLYLIIFDHNQVIKCYKRETPIPL